MNQQSNSSDNSNMPHDKTETKRAAVAIITDGDKFLAIKRSQAVRAPGKICFPGGGVESGETVEQALVREMQEELGVAVRPGRFVWQSNSVRGFELNWWTAEIETGEVITPDQGEVASFEWLTQAQMVAHPELLDSNFDFFQARDRGEFTV